MNSPPLDLVDDRHIYLSGEVIVHPSAAIAPGVFLQADPGCRLTIAEGVCIGQGSVIHAHRGTLDIQTGAILGSGVLIVGRGRIGAHACIGALTTIINSSIEPNHSVPPKSLIGDTSRQLTLDADSNGASPNSSDTRSTEVRTPLPPPTQSSPSADPWTEDPWSDPASPLPSAPTKPEPPVAEPAQPNPAKSEAPTAKTMTQVYGQAYVERIMITMFPHRRLLNSPDDSSNSPSSNSSPPKPP